MFEETIRTRHFLPSEAVKSWKTRMNTEFWRVGHEYRDRAGIKFDDDELLRWLNTSKGTHP